jgi:taurine--2-oxoglutarate transaminase
VFWGGLTYNAHPMCLAAPTPGAIDVMIDEGMVENAPRMGEVMRGRWTRCRRSTRACSRTATSACSASSSFRKNSRNEPIAPYNGSHPAVAKFGKALYEAGLYTVTRWNTFMTNPPLSITEAELREGFAIIDKALEIADRAVV